MLVTPITTHVEDATTRLLSQYRGYPRITGLLQALCNEIQVLEGLLFDVDSKRRLLTAEGYQLDQLGELVAVSRGGLSDSDYLGVLRGTLGQYHSSGDVDTLAATAKSLYGASTVFVKTSLAAAASVAIGLGSPTISTPSLALSTLLGAVAAGVSLYYVSSFDATGAFAMAGPQSWVQGFSDVNTPHTDADPGGGRWATLLYSSEGNR